MKHIFAQTIAETQMPFLPSAADMVSGAFFPP